MSDTPRQRQPGGGRVQVATSGHSAGGDYSQATSEAVNYASADHGAVVVDVSTDTPQLASSGQNVLIDRDDLLWIASEAPQHLVVRVPVPHAPLRFAGWYVWHDYLTNPKTVDIWSGATPESMTLATSCQALPGAGVQLWELPVAIPASHGFIKFEIVATFGGNYTYVNRVFLFDRHPGRLFRYVPNSFSHDGRHQGESPSRETGAGGQRQWPPLPREEALRLPHRRHGDAAEHGSSQPRSRHDVAASEQNPAGSPLGVSTLLKDLDEDIRLLHPLKHITPPRLPAPRGAGPHSSTTSSLPFPNASVASEQQPPVVVVATPGRGEHPHLASRLDSLELALLKLTRAVDDQRGSLEFLKGAYLASAATNSANRAPPVASTSAETDPAIVRSRHSSAARHADAAGLPPTNPEANHHHQDVVVPFPDEALRHYVEDLLAPKLAKHSRRTEERIVQRMDEHLQRLLDGVNEAVERRVQDHLRHVAQSVDDSFRMIVRPSSGHHHHHRSNEDAVARARATGHPPASRRETDESGRRHSPHRHHHRDDVTAAYLAEQQAAHLLRQAAASASKKANRHSRH